MTNEQQRSPIFRLDKLRKHLYNMIWGIKPLLMQCLKLRNGHRRKLLILLRSKSFWPNHACTIPFMRTNGNFSFRMRWRNNTIIRFFYMQRKFSIFLRNDHDCKVVDPYNLLPQNWPHGGIQGLVGWQTDPNFLQND